jgi:UDP-2,3-diacylglucosamine pyrophosphatase LpxH
MKTYRSIFVSDVHLGTKDCKAEQLRDIERIAAVMNSVAKVLNS